MNLELSIIISPSEENNNSVILNKIQQSLSQKNIHAKKEEIKYIVLKKSIDARRKNVKLFMKYKVFINEDIENCKENIIPEWKKVNSNKKVLIIGAGPAGLFGALKLLEKGIKPIIIERGSCTSERKIDIAKISTMAKVNNESNYCFGEGGAGTFSDGKLYTRSNKRGNIDKILNIFVHFGANPKILTDAHPHIGTDKLPQIINNMRNFIIEMGGEFYFDTKCIDFNLNNNTINSIKTINTKTKEENLFTADAYLLATGHSASDIYFLLAKKSPEVLEAKTFAVGVRVEHPIQEINKMQYHKEYDEKLGAAEYRFTSQQNGRGVYSFCMCPGGFVVPSSSGENEIVVNGMSTQNRNSKWSNSAIVVEIRPEDIPEEYIKKALALNCKDLAGLLWRKGIENLTFRMGNKQQAPAQNMIDFLNGKDSEFLPKTSYTPGIVPSRIDLWLPDFISERLKMGFKTFEKDRKGFISKNAILIASETRTSTPVRIKRNKDDFESSSIKKLYPAGEGSGYSGGIVSSAMDGENSCQAIINKLENSL